MIVKDVDCMISLHEEAIGCEICGVAGGTKLEVHHIWPRGIGGGSRLDIGWNLIVLCRGCHDKAQNNHIPKRELWGIAAEREIYKLRRS